MKSESTSATPPEGTDWRAMPYMPPMSKWELAEWTDSPITKTMGLRPAGMSDFDSESDHEWDSPDDEENDLETADDQIIDDFYYERVMGVH
jgi:hypothetical protein